MRLFARSKLAALSRFFSKVPGFSRPDNALHFLNAAQFMGVLNDNIFKLATAFLLISIEGQEHASGILAMASAIFVIPFLLFSSAAGVLADRFSKQRLMIAMKLAEIIIMALAIVAFWLKIIWASYTLLFFLAAHSALFGPSKYAIISELVPSDKVSRANGLITAFTYLGMIVGTFLASFVTEISSRNFVVVAIFCLGIAVLGFISTFGIRYTSPQGSKKKINIFFIREIFHTLEFCKGRKHLLVTMVGAAYFLFIGAYTQLNIIPFAIESLGLNAVDGGYLFLPTALGIAFGSYIAGKVSYFRIELGLSCLSGILLSALLILLSFFTHDLFSVISLLILLGVCGGLFIVPLDSFVQLFSPDEKRGQIIAANNFLSFCGVLLASFALYFYGEVLSLSPHTGFRITGILTFFLSGIMILRLSDLALPYIAKLAIKPFTHPRVEGAELLESHPNATLVLMEATWLKAFLLMTAAPKMHLLIPQGKKRRFPYLKGLFYSIHLIPSEEGLKPLVLEAEKMASDTVNPCIFMEGKAKALTAKSKWKDLFKFTTSEVLYVEVDFSGPGTLISFKQRTPAS